MEEQVNAEEAVEIPLDIPTFYVNSTGTSTGLYDMTLVFKVVGPRTVPSQDVPSAPSVRPLCVVKMSVEHAKIIGAVIVSAVRDYEKKFETTLAVDPERKDLIDSVYGESSADNAEEE